MIDSLSALLGPASQPLLVWAVPFALLLLASALLFARGPRARRRADTAADFRACPVLNAAERRVMADLERILHEHFHPRCRLLAQVSLPEFVRSRTRSDFYAINGQRVDFLIVDSGFLPVCAIEYQGAGHHGATAHSRARTRTRDFTKRRALRTAGVPLVEVPDGYDLRQLHDLLGDVTGRRAGQPQRTAPPRARVAG